MKLPSIKTLITDANETLVRFPAALLVATIGAVAAIVNVERIESDNLVLNNILIVAIIGLPLLISVAMYAERSRWERLQTLALQAGALILIIAYFFTIPQHRTEFYSEYYIRSLLLVIAFHLLVSFAPYFRSTEINGFWQYNKALFLRFLTAAVYSGVLYIGLSIALLAVNKLFDADIKWQRYVQMWSLIAGIFNTWFFLSGMPKDFQQLDSDESYPKGLKIFTQYILIPLVVIYLMILYVYSGKIVVAWNWPNGWVSNLVLGFSITGIFALLLVHPVRRRLENRWVISFARGFYFALLPLVVLLMLSVWRRISEYGITENRYFVLILGLWLVGVAIYFIVSKSKNIKIIPISLFVIALLCSVGPWGAFSVSQKSQLSRLEGILVPKNGIVNGKIRRITSSMGLEGSKEISSIVDYLCEIHGPEVLQPLFNEKLDSVATGEAGYASRKIVGLMGVTYTAKWEKSERKSFTASSKKRDEPREIQGYGYMAKAELTYWDSVKSGGVGKSITLSVADSWIDLRGFSGKVETLSLDLGPLLYRLDEYYNLSGEEYNIPQSKLCIEPNYDGPKIKVYLDAISGTKEGKILRIASIDCMILYNSN